MQYSLFYDWKHYIKPFGLGSAVKPKGHIGSPTERVTELMTTVFFEQPLASPGSAKYYVGGFIAILFEY